MLEKILIENWKDVIRYAHSVKASAVGIAIVGAYDCLPDATKAQLPSWTLSAVAIVALVAVIFVRVIQQEPLSGTDNQGGDNVDSNH